MGTYGVSITANDTARDLMDEYRAAFYYYDTETALSKIDNYVRTSYLFNKSDKEEWCNYYYSLALFMWKNGILTDGVREKTIEMIDNEFGLDIWADSGKSVLNKRKKVLSELKATLLSQQCKEKKIKLDFNLDAVFDVGDIVAFQIQTKDKKYIENDLFDSAFFENANGKYVIIRKIKDDISYQSVVAPCVADHYIVFQLYPKLFDEIPTIEDLNKIDDDKLNDVDNVYCCESKLYHFKKRKYQIIGRNTENINTDIDKNLILKNLFFFGINKEHYNIDTHIISEILNNQK